MNNLSPFRKLLITVGNLPTAYLESMSYYEGLTYLVNYIVNNIDPNVEQNTEAIKELQEYVTHYFDNLDVQEEINNKLDDMAESGTLGEIINVEMIGSLENLETTNKNNLVNAINETYNHIGDLSYLQTTDKSDIVSAINEVLSKLALFNLTTYTKYEYTDIVKSNVSDGSLNLYTAVNDDGSLAKIYGGGYLTATDTTANITLSIQTSLRPSENINIDGSVIVDGDDRGNGGFIQIKPTGEVVITIYSTENSTIYVTVPPCLYYVRNFGDLS